MSRGTEKIPFCQIAELKNSAADDAEFGFYRLEKFVQDIDHLKLPHRHDHFALYFITAGCGSHSLDFNVYDFKPGRMFLSPAGQVHAWIQNIQVKGFVVLFEAAYFNRSDRTRRLRDFIFYNTLQTKPYIDLEGLQQKQFEGLMEAMEREHLLADCQTLIIQSYLTILLYELSRVYRILLGSNIVNPDIVGKVQLFEQKLEHHFKDRKSVKAYADLLHITPNYLNAMCKRVKGKLASEIIQERLMLEAKRFLTHTDQSVSEIAYLIGFEDNSYFGRFFKKNSGMTPADFRRSVQSA